MNDRIDANLRKIIKEGTSHYMFTRINKLLSVFLTVLMLTTNLVTVVPVMAAANTAMATNAQDNVSVAFILEKNSQGETPAPVVPDSINMTSGQKNLLFANTVLPYYLQSGLRQGPEWLRTTDVDFSFTENYKPIFSVETVQPFGKIDNTGGLWFWQGRYAYQSDDKTANLGIGWRKLSEDKSNILGVNTFYDYGFQYNLARLGLGVEYLKNLNEYRINYYMPLSGDRQTGVSYPDSSSSLYSYIRAVEGFDYEVGTALKNAPWLKLYTGGFYYDNKYSADEKGYRLHSNMQLTSRLSVEIGYAKSNLESGGFYGKIQYQLADVFGPFFNDKKNNKQTLDLSNQMLRKIERNNTIKTETWTKQVSIGSLSTAVTDANGQPIEGVQLQAYQNGKAVGNAVVTDSSGTGIISGLAVGTYTVTATYFGYSGTSNPVIIQKGQNATATISLAVTGGNIVVNVFNSLNQFVPGATVTAHVSDGSVAQAEGSLFDRILGVKTAFAGTSSFTLAITTGVDGTAHFNHLPPGNYTFTVNAAAVTMNSVAANVPIGGGTTNVDVVLPDNNSTNTGSAAITVTDGTSAVGGATVSVSVNGTTQTVTTNEAGLAAFANLPVGSYIFTASKTGYIGTNGSVTVTNGTTQPGTLAMTPQTGSVTLTINDGTNPISGATVSATVNGVQQITTTNSLGNVTFINLPTDTYTFTASKTGYNNNTASVTVTNGTTQTGTLALSAQNGSAAITVTDGSNAVSGATVSVSVNGITQTATTNEAGLATFANLPIGSYTFIASKTGYISTNGSVTVTNGTTQTGTLALSAQYGSAAITVTDGTNAVSGATVSVSVNGITQTATTNEAGLATFSNLPVGSYTFTASKTGYNSNTASVTVTNGTTQTGTLALSAQYGSVNLAFASGSNASTENYTVTITNGTNNYSNTINNTTRTATINNIPMGNYTVTVTTPTGYITTVTPQNLTLNSPNASVNVDTQPTVQIINSSSFFSVSTVGVHSHSESTWINLKNLSNILACSAMIYKNGVYTGNSIDISPGDNWNWKRINALTPIVPLVIEIRDGSSFDPNAYIPNDN